MIGMQTLITAVCKLHKIKYLTCVNSVLSCAWQLPRTLVGNFRLVPFQISIVSDNAELNYLDAQNLN